MNEKIILVFILPLLGIVIYAKVLSFLLSLFKVKKIDFKKELIYTCALFLPLNLLYFLIEFYLENSPLQIITFGLLILGMIIPIKYLYKINWKKTFLISALWFVAVFVIGMLINLIVGLILLA